MDANPEDNQMPEPEVVDGAGGGEPTPAPQPPAAEPTIPDTGEGDLPWEPETTIPGKPEAGAAGAEPAPTDSGAEKTITLPGGIEVPLIEKDGQVTVDESAFLEKFKSQADFSRGLDQERERWNQRGGDLLEQLFEKVAAEKKGAPEEKPDPGPGENTWDPQVNPTEWAAHERAVMEHKLEQMLKPFAKGMEDLRGLVDQTVSASERSGMRSTFDQEFNDTTKALGMLKGSTPQTDELLKKIFYAVGTDPRHIGNLGEEEMAQGIQGFSTEALVKPWVNTWRASVHAEAQKLASQMIKKGKGVQPNPHGAGGAGVPPGAGAGPQTTPQELARLAREGKISPKQAVRALMEMRQGPGS